MKKPEIILIAAIAKNNVIGKNNQLLWHIPEDLKRFKKLTMGHPMIMGRKTFESFRSPLKNRVHIVVTREPKENSDQVIWVDSIEKAIEKAQSINNQIYIIGGGEIYKQTIDLADRLEITYVDKDFEGDTTFPVINHEKWEKINYEKAQTGNDFAVYYDTYIKK